MLLVLRGPGIVCVPAVATVCTATLAGGPAGGDGAITYIFAKGEAVPADHPAVKAFPHLFDPADE